MIDDAIRELVRVRAGHRCEYCGLRQEFDAATFHVEYNIARQHAGGDDPENLAMACIRCNRH